MLEKFLPPVVYTTYSGLILSVILLLISVWKYTKRLSPIQRELFPMSVVISAVTLMEIFCILYVVHVAVNGREDIDRATGLDSNAIASLE